MSTFSKNSSAIWCFHKLSICLVCGQDLMIDISTWERVKEAAMDNHNVVAVSRAGKRNKNKFILVCVAKKYAYSLEVGVLARKNGEKGWGASSLMGKECCGRPAETSIISILSLIFLYCKVSECFYLVFLLVFSNFKWYLCFKDGFT